MKLEGWGEQGLIEHLKAQFIAPAPLVGIGDDCAVIPQGGAAAVVQLVTCDAMVEGIHFCQQSIAPFDLGYKALAVNVSDIVAMGGKPLYAFLNLALPKEVRVEWVKECLSGLKFCCQRSGVVLLGGDTVGALRDICISITLLGEAQAKHVKYRHTAQDGDVICVNGFLGDSAAGLRAVQQQISHTAEVKSLISAHFRPPLLCKEGLFLARSKALHAMMDLSDGLDSDLKRLLKAGGCGAAIELTSLPISPALASVSEKYSWSPIQLALSGGEDYCLLMTIAPSSVEEVCYSYQRHFGQPLYAIGKITAAPSQLCYYDQGRLASPQLTTFNHFQ